MTFAKDITRAEFGRVFDIPTDPDARRDNRTVADAADEAGMNALELIAQNFQAARDAGNAVMANRWRAAKADTLLRVINREVR